jgi:hypothetical protein
MNLSGGKGQVSRFRRSLFRLCLGCGSGNSNFAPEEPTKESEEEVSKCGSTRTRTRRRKKNFKRRKIMRHENHKLEEQKRKVHLGY